GVGRLLHVVSGAAITAAYAFADGASCRREVVPGTGAGIGPRNSTLPMAIRGSGARAHALRRRRALRYSGFAYAAVTANRRADLRQSTRARCTGHPHFPAVERARCHRAVGTDHARSRSGP